jgi:hypothetical protein
MMEGGLSPHAVREYLAWSNSIAKLIGRLGLQEGAQRQPTRAEHMDALYGR